jgi:hypothetical protein
MCRSETKWVALSTKRIVIRSLAFHLDEFLPRGV